MKKTAPNVNVYDNVNDNDHDLALRLRKSAALAHREEDMPRSSTMRCVQLARTILVVAAALAFLPACHAEKPPAPATAAAAPPPAAKATEHACGAADEPPCAAPDDAKAPGPTRPGPSCASVTCAVGEHCKLVQVMCIRAPCPPLPECVPD